MSDKTVSNKMAPSSVGSLFRSNVLPWVICGLAAAFYCYEYLLRITPGLMVPELQRAFSINGQYLDATRIGYLSAFYYYAYTPMQLPVGLLMDRYGPQRILTLAVICCAFGSAVFGLTDSWWVAAFGRFLIGFGSAFAFVGVLKLASIWLPPNRFGMVSGLATTLGMVGAMIGVVLLSDIIQNIGWRDTILYSSYVGFLLIPITWFVIKDTPSGQENTPKAATSINYGQLWKEIRYSLKNYQIWLNGVIGGLLMAPTMVFPELWGKLYLQTVHHFDSADASRSVTMIFLGWAVGGPLAGFISDWSRRRRMPIIIGALLSTLLLFFFLWNPSLGPLPVKCIMFLLGVFSSVEVICFAIGRENCPTTLAGTAVAVTNFLIVSFAFFQILVAKILDSTWDGSMLEQAKAYSAESYQTAMLVLPIAMLAAFLLSFLLKETYCRPIASVLKSTPE